MHRPADLSLYTGRVDPEEGPAARHVHEAVRRLEASSPAGAVLLGFESDVGVRRNHGRPGAALGPAAIRAALGRMALPARASAPLLDGGDVLPDGEDLEAAQQELGEHVLAAHAGGHLPIVLGGGHEVAWGTHQGLARALPGARIGVLNFDAHLDLRTPVAGLGSSGTPFRQIAEHHARHGVPFAYLALGISPASNTEALFATADRLGATVLLDEQLGWHRLAEAAFAIDRLLATVDALHLTVDLDVLPAAVAPGVSAPAARGLSPDLFFALLDHALESAGPRLAAADVAELSPPHDPDGRTARIAARVAWQIARARIAPTR